VMEAVIAGSAVACDTGVRVVQWWVAAADRAEKEGDHDGVIYGYEAR
jgi:hypothetical protein